jgi:hypothetical protein
LLKRINAMKSWKIFGLSVVVAIGCGQGKAPAPKKDTPKVEPKPVVVAPDSTPVMPEPTPASASMAASIPASAAAGPISLTAPQGYPAYPYEGLPGWLALASAEKFDVATHYWSPLSTSYQASIFTHDETWMTTATGTAFIAMGKMVGGEVAFAKVSEEPYGCDKTPTKMATFTGAKLPEGAVWLLPKGTAGFAPVEIKEGVVSDIPASFAEEAKKAKVNKVLLIGDIKLLYLATDQAKGKMVVFVGDEKRLEEVIDRQVMAGADPEPITFKSAGEIGVSYPIAAYRFGEKWPVGIVLNGSGYEGVGFEVLRVNPTEAKLFDGISAYYCAF